MKAATRWWVVGVVLAGCGPTLVAGAPADSGSAVDLGAQDTGTKPEDTGTVTPAEDVTTTPPDAGTPLDDLGTPTVDAGPAVEDVPAPTMDTGTAADDTGPVVVADAGALADPSRVGPWRVMATTGALPGSSGDARVYAPVGAPAGTRFPLVVFAHGFLLAINNYDALLIHVASHGYVVASVNFPGSLVRVDHRDVPRVMLAVRAAFAQGQVPAYAGLVDPMRAAAMGHSLGGKGAIMAALDAPAAFGAVVALDPVDDNPAPGGRPSDTAPSVTPERMGSFRVPITLVGATQSRCTTLGTACAPEASNYRQFAMAVPAGVARVVYPLNNFGHNDFVDTACGLQCSLCARGAAPLDTRVSALRAVVVATLGRHLRGEMGYQPYLDGAAQRAYEQAGVLWNGMTASLPPCR